MTIVNVKVGSRKDNWIQRAADHFVKLGIYDDPKSALEMSKLVFESFVVSTDGDEYHDSPEAAVEEELENWNG